MRKLIRNNTFETNSSSIHSLSIDRDFFGKLIDENLFTKKYIIKPFTRDEVDSEGKYESIEDKLRYFITCYMQASHYTEEDKDYLEQYVKEHPFFAKLFEIFPNLHIQWELCVYDYIYEDCEYLFDSYDSEYGEIIELADTQILKHFMQYGVINFADRDRNWDDPLLTQLREYEHNKTKYFTVHVEG